MSLDHALQGKPGDGLSAGLAPEPPGGLGVRKQVEHRLEERIPLEYRSRYSMVMYSHVPYRLAREVGRPIATRAEAEKLLNLPGGD